MNEVFLEDFAYPCAVYAMRRVGSSLSLSAFMAMSGENYSHENLRVGDVVVWERTGDVVTSDGTLTMGKTGPVTTKFSFKKHFGVYEGNGLVSDISYCGDSHYPYIRLMPLWEHPVPRKVLKFSSLDKGM